MGLLASRFAGLGLRLKVFQSLGVNRDRRRCGQDNTRHYVGRHVMWAGPRCFCRVKQLG